MYILLCNDDSYYVGGTQDVGFCFWQHSNGEGSDYTKERLPIRLIYVEVFDQIEFAFKREHQIKKWSRKKKEALIKGDFEDLKILSKKKFKVKGSE